jgi:hypothetical protein
MPAILITGEDDKGSIRADVLLIERLDAAESQQPVAVFIELVAQQLQGRIHTQLGIPAL